MEFNVKVTKYTETGTATISVYDNTVGTNNNDNNKDSGDKKKKREPEYEIEPFGNTKVYNTIPDEMEEFHNKQLSLIKSVARSKRKIHSLMRCMQWDYFITLTYDNAKTDRSNYNLCCKRARIWFQNQRRDSNADNLTFICIPELHKDMESWHMHAVIANVGDMILYDSNRKTFDGKPIYNLSGWKWGFSTAIPIDNTDGSSSIKLSKYVTKYMTKESYMLAKNRHRYFASNNIPEPVVQKYNCESQSEKNALISNILTSNNYNIVYTSHFESEYTNIKYIEVIS